MPQSPSEIDDLLRSLGFVDAAGQPNRLVRSTRREAQPPTESSPQPAAARFPRLESAPRPVDSKSPSALPQESYPQNLFRQTGKFFPLAADSLQDAGLTQSEVGDLILKFLSIRGIETGFNIARHFGLKFQLTDGVLRQLKADRLVAYKTSAAGGDYYYELTSNGRERGLVLSEQCSYCGAAPVPLDQYIAGVKAQSLDARKPSLDDIRRAFSDLDVSPQLISSIGQAIHSGRGMFLFGPPGNGKTSLAERVTRSYGDTIWIPRSIVASGEIIRLYDPNRHKLVSSECDPEYLDGRWIQIERPTIIAGGELRMDNLEITYIRRTGVGEAPLQMKANCGTLLIDDFGRQRMATDELLNRWIVPLEQRHDYLHLESGRSIQVPFDQLIVFSSNLEPRDLVDEAFLRRIPYKIEVTDPSEREYRSLFLRLAERSGFTCAVGALDYLIDTHYRAVQRPLRYCQPRDLLRQMENRCTLHNLPREVNREAIDQAVGNYFSIM